ncbi:dnaJ homolog subfamily A member 3, mitochondrial [Aplysia californica]|uniref:DnaJ homolog subfamily A member 3, mitochondrial n=1 Tax=Aplysia californica TaxID=6500 RepID=A0ABM0ZXU1_APLCA|nr:dnaJ homolog subfamily A member 3, mitochondrial [Aplysia californica]
MAAVRGARFGLQCKVVCTNTSRSSDKLKIDFRRLHTAKKVSFQVLRVINQNNTLYPQFGSCISRFSASFHSSSNLNKKDYYDLLGVPRNADQSAIKKAYYKLAKQFHPDMNNKDPQAAKKFQEVSEAYEVLSDEGRRRDYDAFGMAGQGARQQPGGFRSQQQGFHGFENFQSQMDPEELFRKIFGSAGLGGFGFSNQDFEGSMDGFAPASELMMDLTFQEAARGVNKEITLNVKDTCPKCNGSGAEPGSSPIRCPACNGTGMETISTGPFVMRSTCRQCHGRRVINKHPCTECNGKGKVVARKRVVVPVPAGVENGQTVRMPVGSQEVFITFKVAKSRIFRREGADVHSDVTISLGQAILGGSIRIPGIYDDILLSIPEGTSSHARIRLASKGISRVNSYGYGDHYVHVKIKVPVKLTDDQKLLVQAFAELEKGTEGTINGMAQTKEGLRAIDDPSGKLKNIREALASAKPAPSIELPAPEEPVLAEAPAASGESSAASGESSTASGESSAASGESPAGSVSEDSDSDDNNHAVGKST